LLFYFASYVNENVFVKIRNLSKSINTQKEIISMKEDIAYMKGYMLAKNKKGAMDPISLLIVLILLIMLIQLLKTSGYI
jgi:hypothetical protein